MRLLKKKNLTGREPLLLIFKEREGGREVRWGGGETDMDVRAIRQLVASRMRPKRGGDQTCSVPALDQNQIPILVCARARTHRLTL